MLKYVIAQHYICDLLGICVIPLLGTLSPMYQSAMYAAEHTQLLGQTATCVSAHTSCIYLLHRQPVQSGLPACAYDEQTARVAKAIAVT